MWEKYKKTADFIAITGPSDTSYTENGHVQKNKDKLKKIYSKDSCKVLVGCAPCQPFSSHSFKQRKKGKDDRWDLLDHFVRAIKTIKPEVVSMENVRGVTKTDVFENFVKQLKKMKYKVD